jgi:hypothetical protein
VSEENEYFQMEWKKIASCLYPSGLGMRGRLDAANVK